MVLVALNCFVVYVKEVTGTGAKRRGVMPGLLRCE